MILHEAQARGYEHTGATKLRGRMKSRPRVPERYMITPSCLCSVCYCDATRPKARPAGSVIAPPLVPSCLSGSSPGRFGKGPVGLGILRGRDWQSSTQQKKFAGNCQSVCSV